jgi:protein gp37
MADGTKIEWTDATWNPITGCSVLSAGCKRCYAMKLAGTRMKHHHSRVGLTIETKAGPVWNGDVRFNEVWLDQPLGWSKPRMIFLNAHGDTFHENVPDEWIDKIMARVALSPQHVVQALTKRSERQADYLNNPDTPARILAVVEALYRAGRINKQAFDRFALTWPLPNLWAGVSVEDQENTYRLDDLDDTTAAVKWVSAEPLLGPLDLTNWLSGIDWVVAGGESDKGPNARPAHPDWFRHLRDQCLAAGVAFLFKQWGDWAPVGWEHRDSVHLITAAGRLVSKAEADQNRDVPGQGLIEIEHVGKKEAGRKLDGRTHDGFPIERMAA